MRRKEQVIKYILIILAGIIAICTWLEAYSDNLVSRMYLIAGIICFAVSIPSINSILKDKYEENMKKNGWKE